MAFDFQGVKNALLDSTNICDDAINIIMNMVNPHKFEINSSYYIIKKGRPITDSFYVYKILKRTKVYLTVKCFKWATHFDDINYFSNTKFYKKSTEKIKIRYTDNGDEWLSFGSWINCPFLTSCNKYSDDILEKHIDKYNNYMIEYINTPIEQQKMELKQILEKHKKFNNEKVLNTHLKLRQNKIKKYLLDKEKVDTMIEKIKEFTK